MGTLELLHAAGVGPGDEVIVPAFGNVEVTECVVRAGAHPAFADIDPDSFSLTPGTVTAALTPLTAAVVAVHRFGRPADMTALRALGERRGLLILEQQDPEQQAPEQQDPEQEEQDLRRTGPEKAAGEAAGEQVHRAQPSLEQTDPNPRRTHAAVLDERLTGVRTPSRCPGHTYAQYVVRIPGNGRPDRDAFARALRGRGVACRVPVKTPVHRLPEYRRDIRLPETEAAADETLALPLHAGMTARDVRRLVSACNALGGLLQPA